MCLKMACGCAGAFDSFLNIQITLVLLAQLTICLAFAVGSYAWRQTKGYDNYYLAMDKYSGGNYQNGFVYVIILFITFWILFSYLVPISLFVTIEIIKFVLVSHMAGQQCSQLLETEMHFLYCYED